ncbi:unnamed protein product [marine sediment metagenome]|uniref:Uncharacterized protein n=1 Tax=marine sediment metagenome TaxID=412755 RepID=X1RYX0_9ZZZZ
MPKWFWEHERVWYLIGLTVFAALIAWGIISKSGVVTPPLKTHSLLPTFSWSMPFLTA